MNSRAKGCRGEREFRDVLRAAGFLKAYRTQQYSGAGPDACDVTCPELPSIHFEVKRCERGNPYDWVDQAANDCAPDISSHDWMNAKTPIVAHKRNGREWLVIARMEDFLSILKETDRVK